MPLGLSPFIETPAGNPEGEARVALGRRLFFDANLSVDGTVSCATCHRPELAFSDVRDVSVGVAGARGRRHAPSLLIRAYHRFLFWDGRVESLEAQALVPLAHPDEMGGDLEDDLEFLRADPNDAASFREVFGPGEIAAVQVARALATLAAVIEFYDRGGGENPFHDPLLRKLGLTDREKRDLAAFLRVLTGSNPAGEIPARRVVGASPGATATRSITATRAGPARTGGEGAPRRRGTRT